jgi:outer membrane protein assembly factor BamB
VDCFVYNFSSPAVVGDKVYIPSCSSIICLNLSTGEQLYKVQAYARCPSTPTVADNKLYLAAEEDLFQCSISHKRFLISTQNSTTALFQVQRIEDIFTTLQISSPATLIARIYFSSSQIISKFNI